MKEMHLQVKVSKSKIHTFPKNVQVTFITDLESVQSRGNRKRKFQKL